MVTGFSQPAMRGLMRLSSMGERNTVPSSSARMVALGERHSFLSPYSSCRCKFGVMVAHFTPTRSRFIAAAASCVTASSVASRFLSDRS